MARIIKMQNGLEDKKTNLNKEIRKHKRWIKFGDAISLLLIMAIFCGSAFATTTNTPKSFDQTKQENQAEFEATKKQNQENFEAIKKNNEENFETVKKNNEKDFESKKEQINKQYNDNVAKMEQEYNDNVAKMDKEYQDDVAKMDNKYNDNIKKTQDIDDDNYVEQQAKTSDDNRQDVYNNKSQVQGQKSTNSGSSPFKYFVVILVANVFNKGYRLRKIKELKNQINIYSAGIKGETNALESLEKLSDDYTIITNPIIYSNGRSNELDNLIIGSNGIFIVETKNYIGTISGDINEQNWIQQRPGRNSKEFYNPIMQVSQHGRRVEEFLNKIGYKTKTNTMVYFVNPNVDIKVTGISNTGVFRNQDLDTMLNKIEYFKGDIYLSENDKEFIIRSVTNEPHTTT